MNENLIANILTLIADAQLAATHRCEECYYENPAIPNSGWPTRFYHEMRHGRTKACNAFAEQRAALMLMNRVKRLEAGE